MKFARAVPAGMAAWLIALPVSALAQSPTNITELEAYAFHPILGESSLPVAISFGDVSAFCVPNDGRCTPPALPASTRQPASVLVATTTIGACTVEIRTGNVAVQTYARRPTGLKHAISTVGFTFSTIAAANPGQGYIAALIDLVAVPTNAAACKAGVVSDGVRELGTLTWGGTVGWASYSGTQLANAPQAQAASARKLTMQWDARSIRLFLDDCRIPIFESAMYELRATPPAILFPVIQPRVLLSPTGAAAAACKRAKLS